MARNNIPPRQFRTGHDYRRGRRKLPQDVRDMTFYTKIDVARILGNLVQGSELQLDNILFNPQANNLQRMIARMIYDVIKTGDADKFRLILDRLIGKPTEQVIIQEKMNYQEMTLEQLRDEAARLAIAADKLKNETKQGIVSATVQTDVSDDIEGEL